LKEFAERGYAGTSVAYVAQAPGVSKPALYYYYGNKAGLFQALVDYALDERYRLMQQAALKSRSLRGQLVEILTALFEFQVDNRELMRLAFSTAFASPGEMPETAEFLPKRQRNFEFVHTLIQREQAAGGLSDRFDSKELAFGIHGLLNVYAMTHAILPGHTLDRKTAERAVDLFLRGAAKSK
jgi:AcrR family transcriptional regulator